MMTEDRLAEIERRLAAAPPGPWCVGGRQYGEITDPSFDVNKPLLLYVDPEAHDDGEGGLTSEAPACVHVPCHWYGVAAASRTADFVAHAWQDITDLLAAIRSRA